MASTSWWQASGSGWAGLTTCQQRAPFHLPSHRLHQLPVPSFATASIAFAAAARPKPPTFAAAAFAAAQPPALPPVSKRHWGCRRPLLLAAPTAHAGVCRVMGRHCPACWASASHEVPVNRLAMPSLLAAHRGSPLLRPNCCRASPNPCLRRPPPPPADGSYNDPGVRARWRWLLLAAGWLYTCLSGTAHGAGMLPTECAGLRRGGAAFHGSWLPAAACDCEAAEQLTRPAMPPSAHAQVPRVGTYSLLASDVCTVCGDSRVSCWWLKGCLVAPLDHSLTSQRLAGSGSP